MVLNIIIFIDYTPYLSICYIIYSKHPAMGCGLTVVIGYIVCSQDLSGRDISIIHLHVSIILMLLLTHLLTFLELLLRLLVVIQMALSFIHSNSQLVLLYHPHQNKQKGDEC